MGRVVLDSSVLIALYDKSDLHHDVVVKRFEQSQDQYEISVISMTEVLTAPIARTAAIGQRLRIAMRTAISEIHLVTEEIAIKAADVRVKSELKTVDAIISATAMVAEAQLWTCDQKLAKAHKGAVLIA